MTIPRELVSFLEGGVSLTVGTCDAALRPEAARAHGFRVGSDLQSGTLYLAAATSERTVANLRSTGRVAVTFSATPTYRTVQVKGRLSSLRQAGDDERPWVERYMADFMRDLEFVGMPRRLSERLTHWPAWAAEIEILELFVQTPGPRAGTRLTVSD